MGINENDHIEVGGASVELAEKAVEGLEWYDARKEPISLHGLYKPKEQKNFCRMPEDIAKSLNDGIFDLSCNSAGGRIRFRTDSSVVAVKALNYGQSVFAHDTRLLSSGFDVYVSGKLSNEVFAGAVQPFGNRYDIVMGTVNVGQKGVMHDICINMPVTGKLYDVQIGIQQGCTLQTPRAYRIPTPVVFYGSSITNGYCTTRPGTHYIPLISRELDCDYINLGFSGLAKGEQIMADYIAGLDMSAFVLDYDHNTSNSEHLQATHFNFYETVRKKHPSVPIVMVTKPDFCLADNEQNLRRCVIMETYITARRRGDTNVHFVDGAAVFGMHQYGDCTVDGCHPTDLGFRGMADLIGKTLREAFEACPKVM